MHALFRPLALLSILFALTPGAAFAHAGEHGTGFAAGFFHPVLGLDHLLAMISVGIISAQMGGRAIWSVPLTFVIIMAVGGFIGMFALKDADYNLVMLVIEQGIVASVIILGLTIALDKKIHTIAAMAMVGFFAFFHGFAHGTELPDFASALDFIAGFMCGTALLHIVGVLIGLGAERLKNGHALLRHAGSALVGVGLLMVLQAIEYYFSP